MIVYSINDYLQNDATLISLVDKETFIINPMIGYEDDVAPIVLYSFSPDIQNESMFYIHHDMLRYIVLDTDIDRAFAIRDQIISILNRSDEIQLVNIDDTYGRLLYSNLFRSTDFSPEYPEGFYQIGAHFEVCWIPND
jgi:hypothetical protein